MRRKFGIATTAVLVLSLVVAGCQQAPTPTSTPKPVAAATATTAAQPAEPTGESIKIGQVYGMTGPDSYVSRNQALGADLAVEEINAAGGVLGRPIELVSLDDGQDPQQAVIAAHAFCDNSEIVAVYSGSWSGQTIPVVPIYQECGLPHIEIGSNPRITEMGAPYLVQNSPNDEVAGRACAEFIEELGVKKLAILHNKTMYAEYVSEKVKSRAEELGITVTSFQGVDFQQTTDYTPVLTKIKGEKPDAMYYGGYSEGGLVRKQMVELGMKEVVFVTLERSKEIRDTVGDAGIGMYSVAQSPTLDYNEAMREFAAKFEDRWEVPPETWTVFQYDGIYLIADAIERAGTTDHEAVGKAVRESDFQGSAGRYAFDTSGRMLEPFAFVCRLNEGLEFEPVKVYFGVYENPLPAAGAAVVEPTGESIKIGQVYGMTGPDSYVSRNQALGADLAVEEINAAGGVLGRPIELVSLDDGQDPQQAVIAAHAFCDNSEIVAVYSGSWSGQTIPVVPIYQECGLPHIEIGSNPRITEMGAPYLVQNSPNDEVAGRACAEFIEELGVKKLAILHNKTMYAEYVSEKVKSRAEELGITVTSFQGVDFQQTTDYTPVLTKIKGEKPDAMYYGGYSEGGLVRKQMVELGMKEVVFVTLERSKEIRDTVGDAGIGMYSVAQSPTLDYNEAMREFAAKFEDRWEVPPETWTVFQYDGIYLIADAIERAGTTDHEAVGKAVRESDFQGSAGRYAFDTSGRMLEPFAFVCRLNEGLEFEPVKVYFGVYENPLPAAGAAVVEPTGESIKIGQVYGMTGPDSYVSRNQALGADLAVEEINAAGGVLGRPIELVSLDDGQDPQQAVIAAHAFCDNSEIVAVYSGSWSGQTIPVVPIYQECGLPHIEIGSNPRITEMGAPYLVQNSPNDEVAGRACAEFIEELGVKKLAILHNKTMYAEYVSEKVKSRAEELGITVTSFQGVDFQQTTDYTPVLTKIKGEKPDAMYYGGYSEGGLVRKQMVELGMKEVVFVTLERSKEIRDTVGDAGIGMYSVAQSPTLDYNEAMREFAAKFEDRWEVPPETWTVFQYDGIYLIADAIERAGTTDHEAVGKAVRESDFQGSAGRYAFDTSGRMLEPFAFVCRLNEGLEFEPVKVYFGVYENPLPAAKP